MIVPFELKTGANQNHTHFNQVHAYNIMVRELFGLDSIGLLYYPLTGKLVPVNTSSLEVHEMLIMRN